MPFNIGPFEVLLTFAVLAAVGFFILKRTRKVTPADDAASLDDLIRDGWRIESESSSYVFLVKGQRVNHILHFLVGLFTLSLWWFAWAFIAATGGEKRRSIKKS